jgi:hypothetical protein
VPRDLERTVACVSRAVIGRDLTGADFFADFEAINFVQTMFSASWLFRSEFDLVMSFALPDYVLGASRLAYQFWEDRLPLVGSCSVPLLSSLSADPMLFRILTCSRGPGKHYHLQVKRGSLHRDFARTCNRLIPYSCKADKAHTMLDFGTAMPALFSPC